MSKYLFRWPGTEREPPSVEEDNNQKQFKLLETIIAKTEEEERQKEEAMRKERLRKGMGQNLKKWLGCPEAEITNTSEFYDNLAAFADVLDERMQSEKCKSSQKGRRDSQSSTSHSKKRPCPRPTTVKKNNKHRQHMITATTGMNDLGPSEKRQSSAATVRENLLIEEINVSEAGSLVFPPRVEGEQLNEWNVNHDGTTNDVNLGVRSVDMQAFGASEVNHHAKDGNVSFQASKSFRTKRRKPSSTPRFLKDETDSKLEKLKIARSLVHEPAHQHQKSAVDDLDDNNDASGTSDTFKALREMTVGQRRSNAGGEGGPATEQESNIEGGRKLPVEEDDGERLAERQNGDAENQKPQLPEGFYEVEAIRKKRIKKGQAQYLIKWCGWPESTNTWEPYDHLLACADDVDAFEQRTQSRKKKSSQKGKRTQSRVQAAQQHQKSSGDNPDDNN